MKKNKINVKGVQRLTNHNHLNLFEIKYQDRFCKDKSWIIASRTDENPRCLTKDHDLPDAVIIVPFHRETNKLVIIREYRVSICDYQIGFPAGLMDKGESVTETACREMIEETGLKITRILRTSPPVYSSTGISDESVSMVYAECEGVPSNAGNEGSEDITAIFVSRQEAEALCKDSSQKFDVKTWIILSSFAHNGWPC